jgi:hypothetical protein
VDRCIGLGEFFRGGILKDCAECCEKGKHCQKKPSAFTLFMKSLVLVLILVLVHLIKWDEV